MQTDTAHITDTGTIVSATPGPEDLPAGLPANVIRAITLLERLDAQADEIRLCAEAMRTYASATDRA